MSQRELTAPLIEARGSAAKGRRLRATVRWRVTKQPSTTTIGFGGEWIMRLKTKDVQDDDDVMRLSRGSRHATTSIGWKLKKMLRWPHAIMTRQKRWLGFSVGFSENRL
ncbi:hypothetical protein ACFE04_001069 [Oxalis oulophora]